jgi:hypothetical protein
MIYGGGEIILFSKIIPNIGTVYQGVKTSPNSWFMQNV